MNTILVAGNFHTILQNHIKDVVNANELVCSEVISFLNEGIISPDLFIYTDEGMSKDGHVFVENIKRTVEFTEQNNLSAKIVVMTGNSEILKLALPPQVDVKFFFGKRVPFEEYRAIQKKYDVQKPVSESKGKSDGWLNKLFSSNDSPEQQTISSGLSQGISRVVAVTGHRGSGVTSTAVNLAETAVKEGLSVIVVDLDAKLRGINMYFSGFSNSDNENLSSSLIRLLAKPQSF
ncbi:MAG: hypothetical protein IJN39_00320, partial [Clostridia bacterium]|nr:hypothetical protein [Clostridia bacterium]